LPRPFRGEGRGEGTFERVRDARQHCLQICGHLAIREPEDRVALAREKCRPLFVAIPLEGVTLTVELDRQHPRRPTGEIDNVASDDDLPAKLGTAKALRSKVIPKLLLERRLLRSQALGVCKQLS